jgi:UDP-N-acetylglucosamine 2-epimerase (non-hydrolysing)
MILICYGTRPEWIKIKPLIDSFRGVIPFKVLFTGQHEHIGKFYHDYSLSIKNKNNRLDSIFSSILNAENNIFQNIKYVLVQGDTASTYAMALTAFNRGIKIIHLEAGLRTYDLDNPYPEEAYRQMISRISSVNFCATRKNRQNLIDEKCPGDTHIVGNTVLDNLINIKTSYGNEVIITMHRRENHPIMGKWFYEINELAKQNKDLNFIIPVHPNPNVKKHSSILTHVNIVNPLPYHEMIDKISKCRFLISDSGGIQEESSFLNKKVIVCRKWTERTESVGTHSVMCEVPNKLKNVFKIVSNDFKINKPSPYGDGTAAKKITNILRSKI